MTKRLLVVFAMAAVAFGCASNPAPATDGDHSSPAMNAPPSDHRHPSSDSFIQLSGLKLFQTAPIEACGVTHANFNQDSASPTAAMVNVGGVYYISIRNVRCASYAVSFDNGRHYISGGMAQNYDNHDLHGIDITVERNFAGPVTVLIGSQNFINAISASGYPGNTKGDMLHFNVPHYY